MNSEFESLSHVLTKIYDAAMNSSQWGAALEHVGELVGASEGSIIFGNTAHENLDPTTFYTFGYADEFNRQVEKYGPIWALQIGLPFWNVGDVHHLPETLPREEFLNGQFYKEVLQPNDQEDYIGMLALKDGNQIVPFTLSTTVDAGIFPNRRVELIRYLSPHICRASKISFMLEHKSLSNSLFESTLNKLATAVYLINSNGRVVFMNEAANKQTQSGRCLKIVNRCLVPMDDSAAKKLAESLALANSKRVVDLPIRSIVLPDKDGGLIANILPLGSVQRTLLSEGAAPATFAVFIQDPNSTKPPPSDAFAQLYGLTPTELRVSFATMIGQNQSEISNILGMSLATVKSHLQNIYVKTSTSRQSELMKLIMHSSAPLLG